MKKMPKLYLMKYLFGFLCPEEMNLDIKIFPLMLQLKATLPQIEQVDEWEEMAAMMYIQLSLETFNLDSREIKHVF